MEKTRKLSRCSSSSSFPSHSLCETEELRSLEHAPPLWRSLGKKRLSKQLSMDLTPRDIAWLKRRRQMFLQGRKKSEDLTDEDLNELKGSIELGFGFNEQEGQRLCHTLPALDLYFAVNRKLSTISNSPTSSTSGSRGGSRGSSFDASSPESFGNRSTPFDKLKSESTNNHSWTICNQGDDPQQVKARLRHWAQAVACSLMQSH